MNKIGSKKRSYYNKMLKYIEKRKKRIVREEKEKKIEKGEESRIIFIENNINPYDDW